MALRKKKQKQDDEKQAKRPSLTLPAADDTPLLTVHGEAVHSYRHMLTRQQRERAQLPARLGLLAALRQEGVTYTALALATTLVNDLARSVCVVELNWHWPGMAKQLGDAERGLADVLLHDAALDDVIVPTGLPALSLLPAGDMPLEKRPLLARSEALATTIDALSQRFDHLLLDIPAILATPDAIALAGLCDQCALVVHQGVTPIGDVKDALDDVEHIPMMGVIMNQVIVKTPRLFLRMIPQR